MKHIHKGLVCGLALSLTCVAVSAQTEIPSGLDVDSLNNSVEVAFRTVEKNDLLGGVSVVNMKGMNQKAYSNYSLSFLNNEIAGFNGNIWGMGDYLVVVDGMVRDGNNVLPQEIEQITVLKGAAAVVLYGSRAAKGVVQITTKRGRIGETRINVSLNSGMYVPKAYPKYLGSAQYMTLYNEARANDGLVPAYSETEIYNHGSGLNPYRYPNLNMYSDEFLRSMYNRSEAIAEISGGSNRVQFYTTAGYYRESTLLKVGNAADNYTSRFFVRGNVDIKMNDYIKVQTDANVTFYDNFTASTDWWKQASTLRPNRISPLIPLSYLEENDMNSWNIINGSNYLIDGKYFFGGTQLDPTNPVADAYAAGDSKYVSRQFQFNTNFDIDLRSLLQGLHFRAKYGIDYASTYNQGYSNKYATFSPTWTNYAGKDLIATITQYNKDEKSGSQNISNSSYRYTYNLSGQFDYARTFAEDHNVFGMILANVWQTQASGKYHRVSNMNLGLQASYNYKHKYYFDFSAAMPYSTKLPDGGRAGFSPTVTLGWRLTGEDFFKNTPFDDLMLTASAGVIEQDLDITTSDNEEGYYLYKSILQRGGWYSWADLGGEAATEFQRGDNMDMTYIKRKEVSIGLRGSMWNKLIEFDLNFFMNDVDGGLARANSLYPIYFTQVGYPTSSIIPYVNYNKDSRKGIDFAVAVNKKVGEVDLRLGVTGMYTKSTIEKRDENYAYAYQSRMGKALNGLWGLQSDGFFTTAEEIAAAPQQFGEVKRGDIKYIDQNGDNTIDSNDEVFLGRSDIPMVLGLNLTAKWNNFTFYARGNGFFGGKGFKDNSYYWVRGDNKYSDAVLNRWTPETAATATYPRLTTTNGENNFRASDFWMFKTDRFELAQVQVSYDLPQYLLNGSFVKGLNFFVNGNNLLTISKERKHFEMNVGSAPQTRFYNIGVKATF